MRLAFSLVGAMLASPAMAVPKQPPAQPGTARVAIETTQGTIVVAVDLKHAPVTAANFLRYVDAGKFVGTNFYRAARAKWDPKKGFIEGGIDSDIRKSFAPIAHESTTKTGIRHLDATISMAREKPGSAMGDFFITVGPAPSLDADPKEPGDNLGYAAFGRVVGGMAVVKKILALPTAKRAYSRAMLNEMIVTPPRIIAARRVK